MLSLTFLGTSAARPTVERNVSALALQREGETLLFECGEGTQRQMMRYGTSFALAEIFFTHFHERERGAVARSEEHTSELQSRPHLVCRLLLETKKMTNSTA